MCDQIRERAWTKGTAHLGPTANKLRWICLADSLINAINLQFWPELEVLEIQGNCMEDIYNEHFCKKLKFVDFTSNIIEDIPGLNAGNATILYEFGRSYEYARSAELVLLFEIANGLSFIFYDKGSVTHGEFNFGD